MAASESSKKKLAVNLFYSNYNLSKAQAVVKIGELAVSSHE